jgi:hypothetical protein
VVEAQQVAAAVLLVRVVVGADLADLPVAEAEPLGPAVDPRIARLRVAPGHRPLDAGLLAVVDAVLEEPLPFEVLDRQLRVLADRASALMRAKSRVVMDGVVREVLGDPVRIAGVQRLVVGADVVEQGPDGGAD